MSYSFKSKDEPATDIFFLNEDNKICKASVIMEGGGGSKNAGFIRMLYASKKNIDLDKMKNPSEHLKSKYGKKEEIKEDKENNENELIIKKWTNNNFLGYSKEYDKTKLSDDIKEKMFELINKKKPIEDLVILSLLKNISGEIIKKYGVEELFTGIEHIVYGYTGSGFYQDIEYIQHFGNKKTLPLKNIVDEEDAKTINKIN